MYLIATIEIAKKFSKGPAFAIFGLFIFSFVGWPMLGFGKKNTFNQPPNPDIQTNVQSTTQ